MFTKELLHELLSRPEDVELWAAAAHRFGYAQLSPAEAQIHLRHWIDKAIRHCESNDIEHQILRDLFFADARRKELQQAYDVAHSTLYRRRDRSLQALADYLNTSRPPMTARIPVTDPVIRRPELESKVVDLLLDEDGPIALIGPPGRGKRTLIDQCLAYPAVWRKFRGRVVRGASSPVFTEPHVRITTTLPASSLISAESNCKWVACLETQSQARTLSQARVVDIPAFTPEEALQCAEMWCADLPERSLIAANIVRRAGTEPGTVARAGRLAKAGQQLDLSGGTIGGEEQLDQFSKAIEQAVGPVGRALRALCCFPPAPNTMASPILGNISATNSHDIESLLTAGLAYKTVHGRIATYKLVHDRIGAEVTGSDRLQHMSRFVSFVVARNEVSGFDIKNLAEAVRALHANGDLKLLANAIDIGDVALAAAVGSTSWCSMVDDVIAMGLTVDADLKGRLKALRDVWIRTWPEETQNGLTFGHGGTDGLPENSLTAVWHKQTAPNQVERVLDGALYCTGALEWSTQRAAWRIMMKRLGPPEQVNSQSIVGFHQSSSALDDNRTATRLVTELSNIAQASASAPQAHMLVNTLLGAALYAAGDFRSVHLALQRATELRADSPRIYALAAIVRGCNLVAAGNCVEAQGVFVDALRLCAQHDLFAIPACLAAACAALFYDQNAPAELEKASGLFMEHAKIDHNPDMRGLAETFVGLSCAMAEQHDPAQRHIDEALVIARVGTRAANPLLCALVRLYGGTTLVWCRSPKAKSLLVDAIADADKLGIPELRFRALWSLAIGEALKEDQRGVHYFASAAISCANEIKHALVLRMNRALTKGEVANGSFGVVG